MVPDAREKDFRNKRGDMGHIRKGTRQYQGMLQSDGKTAAFTLVIVKKRGGKSSESKDVARYCMGFAANSRG